MFVRILAPERFPRVTRSDPGRRLLHVLEENSREVSSQFLPTTTLMKQQISQKQSNNK